jgi:peptidoglycan/LPS O-acetylase OafA/YrhL
MLLAPFLVKNIRARWMRPLSFGFYCVTVLYFYLASTVFAGKWTLSNSVPYIFCTAWLPFFILGLKLQKRRITLLTPGVRPYLALFLLMVSAVASGVFWYETATVQLARSQLRLPCILFSLVLAGLLPNLADRYAIHGRIWQLLSRLGEISFFVYLWHRLILIILRSMFPQCAEWYFAFVIAFFIVIAYLLPRSFRKYIWWLGA